MALCILFGIFVAAFTRNFAASGLMYKDCEYKHLQRCDNVFMLSYKVNNQQKVNKDGLRRMYCTAFQRYVDCLSSTFSCKGLFIDLDRLMILQHATIDKKLNMCPNHKLEALGSLVTADLHLKESHATTVDTDNFAKCAQEIHIKCATKMAQDFKEDSRMCYGVRNFVACYNNSRIQCNAKIYQDFNSILQRLAKLLLEMFREKPGVMPNC